jgi:hypothetical protein
MHKQCKQCGDYFKTSIKYRQFCSIKCAIQNNEYGHGDYNLVARCFLCPEKVDVSVLVPVFWDGEMHEVCPMCARELSEQVGDSIFTEEDAMSTLPE